MKHLYRLALAQLPCRVSWRRRGALIAIIVAVSLFLSWPPLAWQAVPAARAASFNINCGDVAGLVSAIITANGNGQADTITLNADSQPNCTYTLTGINNYQYGPNGLPAITSPITIVGNGAILTRGGGAPNFRFFYVSPGGDLTLANLTLSNGRSGAATAAAASMATAAAGPAWAGRSSIRAA